MKRISWKLRYKEGGMRVPKVALAVAVALLAVSMTVAGATILMTITAQGPKPQPNPFSAVCGSALTTSDAIIAGATGWLVFNCSGGLSFTAASGTGNYKTTVTVNTSTNEPWTNIMIVQSSSTPDLAQTSCALAFGSDVNKVNLGNVPGGPYNIPVNPGSYNYCVDYSASPSIGAWVASITVTWSK